MDYVYIRAQYFEERETYKKMLDPENVKKQSQRLYLKVYYGENMLLIPFRSRLGAEVRPYGKIGFALPTSSRPEAGLDYRNMLIVNEEKYIEPAKKRKAPAAQRRAIDAHRESIKREAISYVNGYVRMARKERVEKEAKYRESSLCNFHAELKIQKHILVRESSTASVKKVKKERVL